MRLEVVMMEMAANTKQMSGKMRAFVVIHTSCKLSAYIPYVPLDVTKRMLARFWRERRTRITFSIRAEHIDVEFARRAH